MEDTIITHNISQFDLIYPDNYLKHILDLFFMYMSILPACMSVHHVPVKCLYRSEKVSNTLELELRMVVSHHVSAKNQTQVLCMNKC